MSALHIDPDRIAEQAGGRTVWTDAEAVHLAGCADCRFELDMISAARRLGAARLEGFDATRVAAGVRSRLATRREAAPARLVRHPGRWLAGLAAAAAAVMLAVRTGIPNGPGGSPGAGPAAPVAVSVLYQLDGLSAPELEEVLRSIPPATEALDHVELAPFGDLDANDLERVLRSMEDE
jgi:hypothetical protein